MSGRPILWALVVGVAACGPSAETQRQLDAAGAQRDSLLQEVALNARILSDVSAEIAKVNLRGRRLNVSSESPVLAARDTMIQKLRYVVTRVEEQERRLAQNQERIRQLTTVSDSLRNTLDSTVSQFQAVIESQRTTITVLTDQVTELTNENTALRDTVANVTERENTVYYVIGTKEDLKNRGIITEVGGGRVLFLLWRTGRAVAPARNLDPSQFRAINKRQVRAIQLDPSAEYLIASRQDLEYLRNPPDENGRISGVTTLDISHPELFWRNSKFLIIVRQGGGSEGQTE